MLPTISIFNQTIALYGLMILLGTIIGTTIAILLGKKYGLGSEDVLFASIFGIIGVVVGAKLLYLLIELPWILKNFSKIIRNIDLIQGLLSGGFVFYGGLLGGVGMVYYYCSIYEISFLSMLLAITPAVPLIHSFGRIGCFFAGCCYGIEYSGFGYIVFTNSPFAPNNIPLFPVQLVESFFNIIIFIILIYYQRKSRNYKSVVSLYIFLYSIMRFILEFFRGDLVRGIFGGLSTSQWISIVIFIGTLMYRHIHPHSSSSDLIK